MTENDKKSFLTEDSPSVQTHLGILQRVIDRMASNSNSSKAWCITIVSAILVIVADKSKPDFAFLALFPTFLFFALDTYYLVLEKGFRKSYNSFVKKVHDGTLKPEDLYAVVPVKNHTSLKIEALTSFSIWGFYAGLGILVAMARWVVLA